MTIGAERNKVIALCALLAVAGATWYYQFSSFPETPPAPPSRASARAAGAQAQARQVRASAEDLLDSRTGPRTRSGSNEFKPSLKAGKPGEGPDPDKVDPTLRTDLLAKVQAVQYQGVERNLFQFGAPKPKPPSPAQIAAAKKEAEAAAKKIAEASAPASPPKPAAPPINMKYFGYANRPGDSRRRAFLLDGDDILVIYEGEIIKKRYKVIRIGISSLVVEDLEFHSEQTLPLQENG